MRGIHGMPAQALHRERENIYIKSQSFFMERLNRLLGNVSSHTTIQLAGQN